MKRCSWVNLDNPLYVSYHDNEWGRVHHDDKYLIEYSSDSRIRITTYKLVR